MTGRVERSVVMIAVDGAVKWQRLGQSVQAVDRSEQRRWLHTDGLYGERIREYARCAMVPQKNLVSNNAMKMPVWMMPWKGVVELMLEQVWLVWLAQQWK